MPRKKTPARDLNREREVESSTVRLDGVGEDPAVKAVLSPEFVEMKDKDALNVALALQNLVRGQASILQNLSQMGDHLGRLTARMDAYDKASAQWNQDRQKFVDDVMRRAESLMPVGDRKDRLQAEGATAFQEALVEARAEVASARIRFEQVLASMPQVTVVAPGQVILASQGNQPPAPRLVPTVIRIKHRVWVLRPGVPTSVPKIVADRLAQIQLSADETAERRQVLLVDEHNGGLEGSEVARRMREIDIRYNSPTEPFPLS